MYELTPEGIRRRFKDAGIITVPDDRECATMIRLTEIYSARRSQRFGKPLKVDVVGLTIRRMKQGKVKLERQAALAAARERRKERIEKAKADRKKTKRGRRK